MKRRTRINKASLQSMATGRALLQVFAVSLITSGFVLSANANERKTAIITFDVPGAGTGPSGGTQAVAISPEGTITGNYGDSSGVLHGFVRARDGTFTTFDPPHPNPTRRGRLSDGTLMGAMYFTASSWKASRAPQGEFGSSSGRARLKNWIETEP